MVERWGGQKYLETCFRGVEFFLHFLWGVKKFLRCLSKTFYIKCGGVKILFILHVRGVKKFSVPRRGGLKVFAMLFWIRSPPYCWVINDQPLSACHNFSNLSSGRKSPCATLLFHSIIRFKTKWNCFNLVSLCKASFRIVIACMFLNFYLKERKTCK